MCHRVFARLCVCGLLDPSHQNHRHHTFVSDATFVSLPPCGFGEPWSCCCRFWSKGTILTVGEGVGAWRMAQIGEPPVS